MIISRLVSFVKFHLIYARKINFASISRKKIKKK